MGGHRPTDDGPFALFVHSECHLCTPGPYPQEYTQCDICISVTRLLAVLSWLLLLFGVSLIIRFIRFLSLEIILHIILSASFTFILPLARQTLGLPRWHV